MKIKTFVLSILTLILCAPCFLAADVFLVHGSKARLEPWYQPGGLFYEELSKQSKRMGLGKVIPYTWSGKSGFPESMHYGVKEHLKAAMGIATLLKTKFCVDPRPDNDTNVNHESDDFKIYGPVYLVGHSNGGVISELVSHLLYNPLSPEFKGKRTPPLFRSENGHHSFKDALSDSKRRCRRLLTRVIRSYQSKYTENDPQLKIEQIIMMATPMDRDLYSVNSRVANKVCSLFSMGDRIQWNFGRPPTRQRYPGNKNIVNFRVAI